MFGAAPLGELGHGFLGIGFCEFGVSGCLFCLRFLGAFLPVFGFGFALVFGQVGQAVGGKLVILGKARGGFAAALLGLGGNGGKVLRRKVKILRRGGGGVGLVVFCQLG